MTYDAWEGSEAFVQFEVKPVAIKTASGLISSNASIGDPGKQRTQREPSPITGDYRVLAISGAPYPMGSTNNEIGYDDHLLFTVTDTIESELEQGEASASAGRWKETNSQSADSNTPSDTASKYGTDQNLELGKYFYNILTGFCSNKNWLFTKNGSRAF